MELIIRVSLFENITENLYYYFTGFKFKKKQPRDILPMIKLDRFG